MREGKSLCFAELDSTIHHSAQILSVTGSDQLSDWIQEAARIALHGPEVEQYELVARLPTAIFAGLSTTRPDSIITKVRT